MTKRAKEMALDDVMPGMELSEDLLTLRGKLLLSKGAKLTEASIASLRRYDVDKLSILLSDELSAADAAGELARHQERIARLFRNCGADKATGLLRQYITQFRSEAG